MKTTHYPTKRMSAGERREEILDAAVVEFAQMGLHGTSTEAIAARVGISQPYLFRLFGTKKELFLATIERCFDGVIERFRIAAEANPEDALNAMGDTYFELLSRRNELLLQLQAYAACADPEIATRVRARYGELYNLVEQLSGADETEVRDFFSHGMLLNVAAAIDLPSLLDRESWAQHCLFPEA